jgi:putative peptidoglycan lipid II flippase
VNMALNVVFVVTLVRWNFAAPHAGLAAATTCSALLNAGLLYRGLRRSGVYQPVAGWRRLGFQVVVGVALMAGFLVWLESKLGDWLAQSVWDRAVWLGVSVAGGALVYFGGLVIAGLRPNQLHGPRR